MSEFNLELREVSKSYKMLKTHEVPVLRNINMFVKSGEMISLVGPSGAGKSTLLHIAGLLDSLDSGEVIICGRSMTQSSEKLRTITRRDEVGFVYQFHHLITEFTALENVMLPQLTAGKNSSEAGLFAKELLDEVGLSDRILHKPAELSGGEKQRVALCRALANKPVILLADEPTGNLDSTTSLEIMKLFDEIHKNGNTLIVVTHEEEIAKYAHRVIRLRDGMIESDQDQS